MLKITLTVVAAIFVAAGVTGCASNSIPPEKLKEYSILVPADQPDGGDLLRSSTTIAGIDGKKVFTLSHSGEDVLPGSHVVHTMSCASMNNCTDRIYNLDTKPGLAYVFPMLSQLVEVYDRFDRKKLIEKLAYSKKTKTFKAQSEADLDNKELENQKEAGRVAAQENLVETRKKNLPLVRKIGTRICKSSYSPYEGAKTVVGFVEALADEKVQIRVTDSYDTKNSYLKTRGFTPSIIWDDPMNWDLCEK